MKCKFHPLDDAINYCETCRANYCEICSDESAARDPSRTRANKADHSCFVCKSNLNPISGGSRVPPFWSRLPDVYRYPLNAQAVVALVIVSLATAFLSNSFLLSVIPSIAMMMYSFTCLRETAKGNLKAPGLEACFDGSIAPLFYVLIVIGFLVFGVVIVFDYVGIGMGILLSALGILAIPAIVIIIAVEERLIPALNPAGWVSVVRSTGTSYFVMLLFMIIMTSSVFALISIFGSQSNSFIGVFMQSLISNYYGVVTYYLMGYLVYQNQSALGYRVKNHQQNSKSRSDSERQKIELELLIKAGDYGEAANVARKQLDKPTATLWDWSRGFSLACVSSSDEQAKTMFDLYSSKLERSDETEKLADAYMFIKRHWPEFIVDDHNKRLRVAKSLFETGKYASVINILHMFHQESKDNSLVTTALKLLSDSSSSMKGQEKLAKQYHALYQLQLNQQ